MGRSCKAHRLLLQTETQGLFLDRTCVQHTTTLWQQQTPDLYLYMTHSFLSALTFPLMSHTILLFFSFIIDSKIKCLHDSTAMATGITVHSSLSCIHFFKYEFFSICFFLFVFFVLWQFALCGKQMNTLNNRYRAHADWHTFIRASHKHSVWATSQEHNCNTKKKRQRAWKAGLFSKAGWKPE